MGYNAARSVFLDSVIKKIKNGEDIVIVSCDLGAPIFDDFKINYPERFISVGIAEQNLIAIAGGLALEGKKVIAYGANPFVVTRAFDQIRNLISMMKIPICIVGVGTGLSIAEYGATHYVTEDLALIRMCPLIDIYNVSDVSLAAWLGDNFDMFDKPCYIRFDKLTMDNNLIQNDDENFETGIRAVLSDNNSNNDRVIVSTGNIGYEIIEHIKENKTIKYDFVDVYKFPYDEKVMIEILEKYSDIIVIDESNIENSLHTLLLKTMNKYGILKQIKNYSLDFSKGFPKVYGDRNYLLKNNGLDFWKELF